MTFEQHFAARMNWRYFALRVPIVLIGLAGAWVLMVMLP